MKVTWFRLLCVCLTAEYVRERFYLRAVLSSRPRRIGEGWEAYACSPTPLSLLIEMTICRLKGWERMPIETHNQKENRA